MIDTHAHLYEPDYDDDREETLQRALDAGVTPHGAATSGQGGRR